MGTLKGPYDSFDVSVSHADHGRPDQQKVPWNYKLDAIFFKQKALPKTWIPLVGEDRITGNKQFGEISDLRVHGKVEKHCCLPPSSVWWDIAIAEATGDPEYAEIASGVRRRPEQASAFLLLIAPGSGG